jgi:uncharacterized protein (TIGR00106 family)
MRDSVIAEIKVVPLGTESASLSRYVAACVDVIKTAGDVGYQVTAMGTILQGPLERVLELAGRMSEAPFALGVDRVLTTISIDDRRDKRITMESKVEAVAAAAVG